MPRMAFPRSQPRSGFHNADVRHRPAPLHAHTPLFHPRSVTPHARFVAPPQAAGQWHGELSVPPARTRSHRAVNARSTSAIRVALCDTSPAMIGRFQKKQATNSPDPSAIIFGIIQTRKLTMRLARIKQARRDFHGYTSSLRSLTAQPAFSAPRRSVSRAWSTSLACCKETAATTERRDRLVKLPPLPTKAPAIPCSTELCDAKTYAKLKLLCSLSVHMSTKAYSSLTYTSYCVPLFRVIDLPGKGLGNSESCIVAPISASERFHCSVEWRVKMYV